MTFEELLDLMARETDAPRVVFELAPDPQRGCLLLRLRVSAGSLAEVIARDYELSPRDVRQARIGVTSRAFRMIAGEVGNAVKDRVERPLRAVADLVDALGRQALQCRCPVQANDPPCHVHGGS